MKVAALALAPDHVLMGRSVLQVRALKVATVTAGKGVTGKMAKTVVAASVEAVAEMAATASAWMPFAT